MLHNVEFSIDRLYNHPAIRIHLISVLPVLCPLHSIPHTPSLILHMYSVHYKVFPISPVLCHICILSITRYSSYPQSYVTYVFPISPVLCHICILSITRYPPYPQSYVTYVFLISPVLCHLCIPHISSLMSLMYSAHYKVFRYPQSCPLQCIPHIPSLMSLMYSVHYKVFPMPPVLSTTRYSPYPQSYVTYVFCPF